MKKSHIATGTSALEVRRYLREVHGLEEGEDLFFLAQVIAFLVHSTDVEKMSSLLKTQSHRFSLRKLRGVLDLLDRVFTL